MGRQKSKKSDTNDSEVWFVVRALIDSSDGDLPRSAALSVARAFVEDGPQQAIVVLNACGWEVFRWFDECGAERVRVAKKLKRVV